MAMRSRACISTAYLLQGPACPLWPYLFPDPDQNVIKLSVSKTRFQSLPNAGNVQANMLLEHSRAAKPCTPFFTSNPRLYPDTSKGTLTC